MELVDEEISKTSKAIEISMINKTDEEMTFLEEVYMEKYIDKNWYYIANIRETLESAMVLMPNVPFRWTVPLEIKDSKDTIAIKTYDSSKKIDLAKGKYRLVAEIYDKNAEIILVSVEFFVDE